MQHFDKARRRSASRVARRWLYLIHRWIGVASCLLFAMWFISGLVMIYVPYPSLSAGEKLAKMEPITWSAVNVPPPVINGTMPRNLSVEMRDGVPVWRVEDWEGGQSTIAAARGARLAPVNASFASRVAARFGGVPIARVERVERDQWTVAGGFDRHRPLWRVDLADTSGTSLYVSSSTGGIVQETTRKIRFWNWLGSVPHWIYPTILRRDGPAWRQVVLWVSGPCIAAAITGIWIGILRTRIGRRRFKGGSVTPYHGWMLWHHAAGMVGGFFLLTWIFSGWLSVDPGRLFQSSTIDERALRHYMAGAMLPSIALDELGRRYVGVTRVEILDNAGQPLVVGFRRNGTRDVRDAATLNPISLNRATIVSAARVLLPRGRITSIERLTRPDAYWYEPGELPRLPVLRLRFDDPANTWLTIDPVTGEVLETLDSRRRLYRWFFDLLHKWDFNILTLHRPAWDLLLWILSAAGLVTSGSGIWISWKRLERTVRKA